MELAASARWLLEAAPDAMLVVDATGRIAMFNDQAERLFGYQRAEILNRSVEELVPETVRDAHVYHRARYNAHPTTRPMGAGIELHGRRRDGTTFPAEISLSSLRTPGGLLVCAAVRDVTARQRAEQETRAAREEAERANQAKSEFLSRMSHELRTPLNAILGFAQLLEYQEPRPDQVEAVQYILDGGRHLLGLIDEVLDISRIESGHLPLALAPVPVGEVVRETVELMGPAAGDHQVQLRVDPASPAEAVVLADRQRFKQVLLNLVSNGVKYNRPGGEVRLSWHVETSGDVVVRVADTGIGIRPEEMDRLFLPFERLGQTGSNIGGTGLGLAVSRGLVHGMQGRIGAESTHRHGSTFWVALRPATPADEEVVPARPRSEPAEAHAGRKILYIEDNLSNVRLVESILSRRPGLSLQVALDGDRGVEVARAEMPDVVLLDLHLPDLSGEEVFERLRSDPVTAAIPIIVVSADALPDRVETLVERGAFDFVTKPLDVTRFMDTLDRALALVAARR